jgi:hypothetical protein
MAQSLAAFGLYPSSKALHFGAEALRAAKFRHTDISVMYSDGQKALHLRESLPSEPDVADEGQPSSLAGLLTTLSGIGAVALSKDGPFMVGGPILGTLVSAGESLLASLRGLGIPERDVEPFGERLRHGGLLLSVQCDDQSWMTRAREILEKTGAERVAIA